MTASETWVEEIRVRSAETDFRKNWKISGFFSAMMEAAANHASRLGFDFRDMLGYDMVWLLSRLKIQFYRFPVMGETVVMQTWPKGIQQKLFFMRDYHITGGDGVLCAAATSAYLLVNTRARRILPPQALPGQVPHNDGFNAIAEPLEKIPPAGVLESRFSVQAGYSAVDLMEHVNNARYIDWICDCFSMEEHRSQTLRSLQINYVNEVKPGETVLLERARRPEEPGCWYVTGNNQTSGLKAFDAELVWQAG